MHRLSPRGIRWYTEKHPSPPRRFFSPRIGERSWREPEVALDPSRRWHSASPFLPWHRDPSNWKLATTRTFPPDTGVVAYSSEDVQLVLDSLIFPPLGSAATKKLRENKTQRACSGQDLESFPVRSRQGNWETFPVDPPTHLTRIQGSKAA